MVGAGIIKNPIQSHLPVAAQPGSVFKPFVYLAALMYGSEGRRFTPVSLVEDSAFTWSYEGQEWQPANYRDEYFGTVTFQTALERSLNSATARVAREVGIRRVRDIAYRLGIQARCLRSFGRFGRRRDSGGWVGVCYAGENGGVVRALAVKQIIDQEAGVWRNGIQVEKGAPAARFMRKFMMKGVLDAARDARETSVSNRPGG